MEAKLTFIERDALLDGTIDGAYGAGIVIQQADEAPDQALRRARRDVQVLRETGYRITSVRFLLGPADPARLAERIELACGLSQLLAGRAAVHLVATKASPQINWFELVGWLLADPRWALNVQLTFRDELHALVPSIQPAADWAELDTIALAG